MATRPQDVEILVHVNAPSRVVDDAHYRQLAEAYLDFEPSCSTALPSLKELNHHQSEDLNRKGSSNGSQRRVQQHMPASSSQGYATPAPISAFIDSQELSFQSALDNRESPRLGDTKVGITLDVATSPTRDGSIGTQQSWRAPPSEIGDSFPMPDPSLLRGSPSKVLERYLRSSTARHYNTVPSSTIQACDQRPSQSRSHIDVPSSPLQGPIEVPSSQPEHIPLPTIPSSPPPINHGQRFVPVSSERDGAEQGPVIPTSDDAPDVTHISSSPITKEPGAPSSQGGTPSPASDGALDVTHITGNFIEGDPAEVTNQEKEITSAPASAPDDPVNVMHISSSANADGPVALDSQKQDQTAAPEDPLDVTHISMSSVGDSSGAPPSQKRELPPEARDNLDVTHISSSSFEVSPLQTKTRSPPPSKRRRRSESASPSPIISAGATDLISVEVNTLTAGAQSALEVSLEIMPPSPPSGIYTIHPDDLIPSQLSKLAADLSSRYRPSAPTRDLESLERGYWLIDCDSWPVTTRDSTWAFLTRYVRSGLAGWGVWCRREETPHRFVKAYCWGHVVKHTYLLLYLASERRLKGTGGVWIDADGEVVIRVPPYGK